MVKLCKKTILLNNDNQKPINFCRKNNQLFYKQYIEMITNTFFKLTIMKYSTKCYVIHVVSERELNESPNGAYPPDYQRITISVLFKRYICHHDAAMHGKPSLSEERMGQNNC